MATMDSTENEKSTPLPQYSSGPSQYGQEYAHPPSYPGEPPAQQPNPYSGAHTSQLPQNTPGVTMMPPPPQQVVFVNRNSGLDSMQSAIPVMPLWCAIILCVVNVILPGIGTIIASMTVFCCSQIPQTGSTQMGVFCINFWIGWCQLLTVWVFLIGWIWSIAWGVIFITLSVSTYGKLQQVPLTTATVQFPSPQVVTLQ